MTVRCDEGRQLSRFVRENEWLIAFLARRGGWNRRGIPRPDLLQAGRVGLWKAARRFEPSRSVKFPTYAWAFVVAEFQRELKVARGMRHASLDDVGEIADGPCEDDLLRSIDAAGRIKIVAAVVRPRDLAIVMAVLQGGLTPAEAARQFAITRARVGQILSRATTVARSVAA